VTGIDPAYGLSPDLIAVATGWRHHLHKNPELAFNERQTADFVASQLFQSGLTIHRGLAGTGVVGTLTRGTGRRAIAIRADMDALPIQEQSGAPHASSIPGVMHACGHDGHVAMALTAARICARLPDLDGTVHFIFQPAEENEGGGRRMVEDGLFRLFPCDAVYALHNWPALPLGTCVARGGAMMAALAVFEIVISGRGCHAAMPHEGTDSILAACNLACSLQSIVGRNIDPLHSSVVSATQIRGGDTWNVIPDTCVIRGTTRWFEDSVGDILEHRITELSKAIVTGFGCAAQIRYDRRIPATINDPTLATLVRAVASASPLNLTVVDARPTMGSEDFAFMLQTVPGCYLWLGAGKTADGHGLHSPHYDFNDELIPLGVEFWVSLVRQSLARA
jgi:hippurate hydrolase